MTKIVNIKRKFLDASGLTTLWANITNYVSNFVTTVNDPINKTLNGHTGDIANLNTAITNLETGLDSYRGYKINVTQTSADSLSPTLYPNTYNVFDLTKTSGNILLTLHFNNLTDVVSTNSISCEYVIELKFKVSNITLGLGTGNTEIVWENDDIPKFDPNYKYIISFIKNSSNDSLKAVYGQYHN